MKFLIYISLLFFSFQYATACSLVCGTDSQHTLIGFNEDFEYENPYIWFTKQKKGKYGCAFVSYNFKVNIGIAKIKVSGKLNPQQGINEKGLFFDGFATPYHLINDDQGKKKGNGITLKRMLQQCSNVDEAVSYLKKYHFKGLSRAKFFLADRSGNYLIYDGLNIIKKENKNYCVVTNFLENNTQLGNYPCERYDTGKKRLVENNELSTENFSSILYAMQQNAASLKNGTMYSGVFELNTGNLILYNYQDYNNPFKINLSNALQAKTKKIKFKNIFKRKSYEFAAKKIKKMGAQKSYTKFLSLVDNTAYSNSERDYIFFSKALKNNNEIAFAKKVAELGLKKYPNSLFLSEVYLDISN
jgi:choloylglycine hydrolase